MGLSQRRRFILLVTMGYLLFGSAWIFLSDRLLLTFTDVAALTRLSTAKGIAFILLTALLLALGLIPDRDADQGKEGLDSADLIRSSQRAPRWVAYGFAVVVTVAMLLVRMNIAVSAGDRPLLILFMLPIILSSALGGLGPGLVATGIAALGVNYCVIAPVHSLRIGEPHDLFQWCMLIGSGMLASYLNHLLHRARRQAEERRRLEEVARNRLQASEARLKLFIEHAPASLAMFDRDMRYLAVSRRWLDDYGLGNGDILGQCHYQVFPEIGEGLKAIHRRALAGSVIRADEDCFQRADGSSQWLRWEVRPWSAADGQVGGIVIFSEDITRSKEAEQEILRLNADLERRVTQRTAELTAANQELDAFAYAVSHDLRAPLRAMSGFSQALIEDYGSCLQGEGRVFLDQIIIGSQRMGALIDGLLTLSRSTRSPLQRHRVDLGAMAERLLRGMASAEPARTVDWQIEAGLVGLGDATMLEVVMVNLLANAWKYTSRCDQAHIRVFGRSQGADRFFCVADNGAGFEMAHAAKLFQPFQRLHRQEEFTGIGIGLATAQRIIHRHGGVIIAEGRRDQGATFCFTLPDHDQPQPEAPDGQ